MKDIGAHLLAKQQKSGSQKLNVGFNSNRTVVAETSTLVIVIPDDEPTLSQITKNLNPSKPIQRANKPNKQPNQTGKIPNLPNITLNPIGKISNHKEKENANGKSPILASQKNNSIKKDKKKDPVAKNPKSFKTVTQMMQDADSSINVEYTKISHKKTNKTSKKSDKILKVKLPEKPSLSKDEDMTIAPQPFPTLPFLPNFPPHQAPSCAPNPACHTTPIRGSPPIYHSTPNHPMPP